MEKYITWYVLQLKTWVKKPIYWIELTGMLFLTILIQNVSLPQKNNTKIGIYNADGAYVQRVIEQLKEQESVFQFQVYDDSELLKNDIVSGTLECGFVFEKGFEKNWGNGKYEDSITYICTPLTTKGYVAQETVFATVLRQFSRTVLEQSIPQIFKQENDHISQQLLKANDAYLDSNVVFSIDTQLVKQEADFTEAKSSTKNPVFPVQGMTGMIIFITMLLNGTGKFGRYEINVLHALDRRNQRAFAFTNNLAAVTLEAVAGMVIILGLKNNRGVVMEITALFGLILISAVWVLIFGRLIKNEITFASTIIAVIVINLMICPVFINLAQYIPALQYISCCFPVGIYLCPFFNLP